MEKVRVGLIGCGGRQQAHISGLAKLDFVEIVAVADPVEERAKAAAEKTGAKKVYRNHTELYDNEGKNLDCVFIAVEPTAHSDIEERAIELNLPFLVEKPMTLDIEKAEKIAEAVEAKGLVTCVGFQDRYLDLVDMIKDELPKHKQGAIVYGTWCGGIPGVWWWQDKKTCGGQLVEQNIHLLDGLRYLFGEPESVYAINGRGIVVPGVDAQPTYNNDDYSVCLFKFPGNVAATLVSSCFSKGVRPMCGYKITLEDMTIDYYLRNNITFSTQNKTVDIRRTFEQTDYLDKAFIEAVIAKNPAGVKSPYADALKSLKLAFAAEKSMATGEAIHFNR